MVSLVDDYAENLIEALEKLRKYRDLREITQSYEAVMRYRYKEDPLINLRANRLDRFFYLQGLAAFAAMIPSSFKCSMERRIGREFLIRALIIAPKMARRDMLMAATYFYLKGKETQ